ncbi:MAG: helix-turn-helix domain-containing protein [Synergistaceae bacterium]|nr:helix-turn-helix domain-containing protein [Synergistaceae bacterium]
MARKWMDALTDKLCEAFLSLETVEEMYNFLEDVATIGEIKALAQRLEVARLLSEEKTYPQIAAQTGASTATISRVKKCFDHGADGYKTVLVRKQETRPPNP